MNAEPQFESFEAFAACHRPHIRPAETEARLRRAFEIDLEFTTSFRLLRPYLKRFKDPWSDRILAHLARSKSAEGALEPKSAAAFARIFKRHFGDLYRGRFDAAYLASVEEVALYMAYRDVKSVWLAGAYQKLLEDLTRQIVERNARARPKPFERVLCLAAKTIAIEMNQIQRVFTLVETHKLRVALEEA